MTTKYLFSIGGRPLLLAAWFVSACGGAPDAATPAPQALSIQDLDGSVPARVMRPPGAGGGTRQSAPLSGSATTNLSYNDGSVETAPRVYLVFWGSQWSSDPSGEAAILKNLFLNIGGSAWNETVTQYCQGVALGATSCSGAGQAAGNPTGVLAGYWYDNGSSAPSQPTQSQIAGEAGRAAAHFGNTSDVANANVQYFIATAHNNNSAGFGSTYCAYHSWASAGYPSYEIAYVNMPYTTDAANCGANFNGLGPKAGITIVAGHEFAETETDPFYDWGWRDGSGDEIGDKCAWISSGQGAVANVALGNGVFPMQSLWSNALGGGAGGCVMGSGVQAPLYAGVGPGLCLDVPASNTTPGTLLQTWTCTGGANQEWIYVPGTMELRSALSPTLCLEIPGASTTPGTQVATATCNGGTQQKWVYSNGRYVSGLSSVLCLDVRSGSTAPGTPVQTWTCNGGTNQLWFDVLRSGVGAGTGASLCLDVPASNTTPGTLLQTWTCTGGANQEWIYDPSTGELRSALAPNLCLDVPAGTTMPGTQVQIWTCNGGANQKWIRTDGGRYVSALGTGLCLDVRSDSATPGTPVQTWSCTGGINQFWY